MGNRALVLLRGVILGSKWSGCNLRIGFLLILCFSINVLCAADKTQKKHKKISQKIIDCFLFFNELELLTIRLEELYDHVDCFVLVEAAETFRGNPKPYIFEENKSKFQKYLSKIVHVKIEDRKPSFGVWEREAFQRNCIRRGLTFCHKDDIILMSDLDEIPRASVLPLIQKRLCQKESFGLCLEQKIYFFQLNRQTPAKLSWDNDLWFGTIATTYEQFDAYGPQVFRMKGRSQSLEKVFNAGWHFTYMGNVDGLKAKLQSYAHGDGNASHVTEEVYQACLDNHPAVPIDDSFPKYVREHLDYYKSIGFIAQ